MREYDVGERVAFQVPRCNMEPNFDRACEQAYVHAAELFGYHCGHLEYVKNSERSTDCIAIEFKGYQAIGSTHHYFFETWVERAEDEQ